MRQEFIKVSHRKTAKDRAPWATKFLRVGLGWIAFECPLEYAEAKQLMAPEKPTFVVAIHCNNQRINFVRGFDEADAKQKAIEWFQKNVGDPKYQYFFHTTRNGNVQFHFEFY